MEPAPLWAGGRRDEWKARPTRSRLCRSAAPAFQRPRRPPHVQGVQIQVREVLQSRGVHEQEVRKLLLAPDDEHAQGWSFTVGAFSRNRNRCRTDAGCEHHVNIGSAGSIRVPAGAFMPGREELWAPLRQSTSNAADPETPQDSDTTLEANSLAAMLAVVNRQGIQGAENSNGYRQSRCRT